MPDGDGGARARRPVVGAVQPAGGLAREVQPGDAAEAERGGVAVEPLGAGEQAELGHDDVARVLHGAEEGEPAGLVRVVEGHARRHLADAVARVEVLVRPCQLLLERGARGHDLEGGARLVLVGERPVARLAGGQVRDTDRSQDLAVARVHEEREAAHRAQRVHRAREVVLDDALQVEVEGQHGAAAVGRSAAQAARQPHGAVLPDAELRGPAGPPAQLVVQLQLEPVHPAVVEIGAAEDLAGGGAQRVVAPRLHREVHAAPLAVGHRFADLGRLVARHPDEARVRAELRGQSPRVQVQQGRQAAGHGGGVGHLARGRRDRAGHQVARQRAPAPVQQLAADRADQHALLLVQLRALRVVRVLDDLQPRHAQPQDDQTKQQTGRSHQHPAPARIPVGQLLPSVERRFTRTAGPSQARCGGAAGRICRARR